MASPRAPQNRMVKEGPLKKKSPSGLKGFRKWQSRWVQLDCQSLRYYKDKNDTKAKGIVMLRDITGAQYLPEKRVGARFDLKTKQHHRFGGSTYHFDGGTSEEAMEWVKAVAVAVQLEKEIRAKETGSQRSFLDAAHIKHTALQDLFFEARFTADVMNQQPGASGLTKKQEETVAVIKREFPTTAHILRYLLNETFNPVKNAFIYDNGSEDVSQGGEEPPAFGHAIAEANADRALQDNVQGRMIALVISPDFRRHLSAMFREEDDCEAHYLGLRVMWAVFRGTQDRERAAKEFTSVVSINCSKSSYTADVRDALLAILLSDPCDVTSELDRIRDISFRTLVRLPSTWPALFTAMKQSNLEPRAHTLRDLNALFLDSFPNCQSFTRQPQWTKMVFELVFDLALRKKDEEPTKSVMAYCMGLFIAIFYQYFLHSNEFPSLVQQMLSGLYAFTGACSEGSDFASRVFASLAQKLAAQRLNIKLDPGSTTWNNLMALSKLVRRFVLMSNYWQSHIDPETEEEILQARLAMKGEPASPTGRPPSSPRGRGAGPKRWSPGRGQTMRPVDMASDPVSRHSMNTKALAMAQIDNQESEASLLPMRKSKKRERKFSHEEIVITDYGLHWCSGDGVCADMTLLQKMDNLFCSTLKLHEFDPELDPSMEKEETDLFLLGQRRATFWQDALNLATVIKRQDIATRQSLTYRKFSHLVERFCTATSSEKRIELVHQIEQILRDETPTGLFA